jgi:hypothetical protein
MSHEILGIYRAMADLVDAETTPRVQSGWAADRAAKAARESLPAA